MGFEGKPHPDLSKGDGDMALKNVWKIENAYFFKRGGHQDFVNVTEVLRLLPRIRYLVLALATLEIGKTPQPALGGQLPLKEWEQNCIKNQ